MTGKEIGPILLALLATTASGAAVGAAVIGPSPIDAGSSNEPPLADAGLDQTVTVDESVLLDGGGSRDPDGEITTYRWEITTPGGSAVAPDCPTCELTTFVPDDSGVYEVELAVTDDEDVTRSDTLFVTAERADGPSVSLDGPSSVTEGNQARYRASVDAGDATLDGVVWRVGASVVDRGNLSGRHGEAQLRRTFDDPGTVEVSVTAVDEAGRDASAGMDVAVDPDGGASPGTPPDPQNEEPTVTIEGPDLVEPGDYESFTALANDPDGVIVDYEWSNAESIVMGDRPRAGHRFTEGPGRLVPITVTVEDDDGESATDTTVVRINRTPTAGDNRPPEVSLDAPDSVEACEETEVDLTADADDPDGDSITYNWDGVDSSTGARAELSVAADDSSEVEVSVEVEDTSGATSDASETIFVTCQGPTPEIGNLRASQSQWSWSSLSTETVDPFDSGEQVILTSSGNWKEDQIPISIDIDNPLSKPIYVQFDFGTGETRLKKVQSNEAVTVTVDYAFPFPRPSPTSYTVTASAVVNGNHVAKTSKSLTVRGVDGISSGSSKLEQFTASIDKTDVAVGEEVTTEVGVDAEKAASLEEYQVNYGDGTIDTGEPTANRRMVDFIHSYDNPGEYEMTIQGLAHGDWVTLREEIIYVDKTYTVHDWDERVTKINTEYKKSWSDPGSDWVWENHVRTTERATGETTVQPAHMPSPPRGDGYYWKKIDSFTRYGWPHEKYEKYETASLNRYKKTTTETVRGNHRQSLSRPQRSEVYGDSLSSTEYECSKPDAPLHDEAC